MKIRLWHSQKLHTSYVQALWSLKMFAIPLFEIKLYLPNTIPGNFEILLSKAVPGRLSEKNSVLQAQLWDYLVLRTILAFLFSGMHTDHDLRGFFAKKSPVIQVKILTLNKNLWHLCKHYMNAEKLKKKKKKCLYLLFSERHSLCSRLSDTLVPGKLNGSGGHSKCSSLQDSQFSQVLGMANCPNF